MSWWYSLRNEFHHERSQVFVFCCWKVELNGDDRCCWIQWNLNLINELRRLQRQGFFSRLFFCQILVGRDDNLLSPFFFFFFSLKQVCKILNAFSLSFSFSSVYLTPRRFTLYLHRYWWIMNVDVCMRLTSDKKKEKKRRKTGTNTPECI